MEDVVVQRSESKRNVTGIINVLMQYKIGPLPLPVYVILAGIIISAAVYGKLPADMIGGMAIMMILGMLLGDVGLKVPVLKEIGGPAILSIFVPSCLVFYHILDGGSVQAIDAFMKGSNFLYFYISCLVVGSILGMVRKVLIQGFLRMFVPLIVGTATAITAGVGVGILTGVGAYKTFFYIVVPIISGGVGEGILPLSVAYSEILGSSPDQFISMLVPAAMLGNVFAIISAGILKKLGEMKPNLTGNGTLVKYGDDDMQDMQNNDKPVNFSLMGAGLILACSFYIAGRLLNMVIPIPAPIIMIIGAALIKALGIMPEQLEQGAFHLYKFVSTNLTWALLVGIGVLYTPWDQVIAAITPAYVLIVLAVVLSMVLSGFFVGRLMNMYPIESACVTACHSGLGGTGDVAILSSCNRMELMPFSQISTRIGGVGTVVAAAILMRNILIRAENLT
jgi:malate:Na+ symporter